MLQSATNVVINVRVDRGEHFQMLKKFNLLLILGLLGKIPSSVCCAIH